MIKYEFIDFIELLVEHLSAQLYLLIYDRIYNKASEISQLKMIQKYNGRKHLIMIVGVL